MNIGVIGGGSWGTTIVYLLGRNPANRVKLWVRNPEVVTAINFGSSPLEPQPLDDQGKPKGGYANRRAEMWGKSKEWLQDPGGVDIPDRDALQVDACAPGYKYDSLSRVLIESKDDIRKRGLRSPDEWDAVALTFAEPVSDRVTQYENLRAKSLARSIV